MQSDPEIRQLAIELLASQNLSLVSCKPLQTLWAGYGHICHIRANRPGIEGSQSFIFKYVSPPVSANNTKTRLPDEGHIRKLLSYQVEQYFYTYLAPLMPNEIAVAS